MNFWAGKNVLVTGGRGFFGSHVVDLLRKTNASLFVPDSAELDLRLRENCRKAVKDVDIVLHFAGLVGGIGANISRPADFFFDNLSMGMNLMEEARLQKVQKFVAIGTACSYPKFASLPFKEENFWGGYPEETNAPYALAKKMLLVQAQAYRQQYGFNAIYLIPTNLYGPRDKFDLNTSHVIPALIRKVLEAKQANKKRIPVWGDGTPTRDFLFVEDAAEAVIMATENYNGAEPVNIGSGKEISIKEVVEKIVSICDFEGEIFWDESKPTGQPRRCLDTTKAKKYFGWQAKTDFDFGLRKTIEWYKEAILKKNLMVE